MIPSFSMKFPSRLTVNNITYGERLSSLACAAFIVLLAQLAGSESWH
jgi:hypothetical protein